MHEEYKPKTLQENIKNKCSEAIYIKSFLSCYMASALIKTIVHTLKSAENVE